VDDRYSHAHWLFQHNGGVFLPPWGKIEQWLISVQHDEADIDRLVENFAMFARPVSGSAVNPGAADARTAEEARSPTTRCWYRRPPTAASSPAPTGAVPTWW
jgi:hypothetical protein